MRKLAAIAATLSLVLIAGCAAQMAGTQQNPIGNTFAGGSAPDGCKWYLANGKEYDAVKLHGTVCGGKLDLDTTGVHAFAGQEQGLAAQAQIAQVVKDSVLEGVQLGIGAATAAMGNPAGLAALGALIHPPKHAPTPAADTAELRPLPAP